MSLISIFHFPFYCLLGPHKHCGWFPLRLCVCECFFFLRGPCPWLSLCSLPFRIKAFQLWLLPNQPLPYHCSSTLAPVNYHTTVISVCAHQVVGGYRETDVEDKGGKNCWLNNLSENPGLWPTVIQFWSSLQKCVQNRTVTWWILNLNPNMNPKGFKKIEWLNMD